MKPERDPVTCTVTGCDHAETATLVATPCGAMCREHADEFAESLGWRGVDEGRQA